jgi:NAD(P)-dependent dehydrogenase (short-subunit alcohol dehydrogenase family)
MTGVGRVVVITGAAQGIGAAMAVRLSARGWRVALLDRDASLLGATTALCGEHAASWQVDVTDAAALAETAEKVVAHFGRVDAVVANAGIGAGGTLLLQDPAVYERVIEVNLLGSVRTVRAFLPALIDSRGYVLQIASLAAMTPAPLMSAYCASKSGVEAFAHSLRGELSHRGVDVGVAYLSFTDTSMVRTADEEPGLRLARKAMPAPFGTTSPLAPAVERLVRGFEARRAHVYAQGWLRLLPAVRGLLPALTARSARGIVPQAEALLSADRPGRSGDA